MEINYELTEKDYLDFNVFHAENSPTIRRSILIQRLIGPVIFLIMPFYATRKTGIPLWYWLIIFGTLSALWYSFYPKYIKWEVSRRTSKLIKEGKDNTLLGNRTIKLTPEGVHDISEHGDSKVKWGSIERIEKNETHIYIYISSISSFIIPIRAFKDLASKEVFMMELDKDTNSI